MTRYVHVGSWWLLGTALALAACAVGSEATTTEGTLASSPVDEDAGTQGESVTVPAKKATESTAADAPADGGSDAGADAAPPAQPDTCPASNSCQGAVDLGTVAGDVGTDAKTTQGSTSQWLKVRVLEKVSGISGAPLQLKAVLTSPPGEDFDVYLYVPSDDVLECSSVADRSESTGTTDTAGVVFGETGAFGNSIQDDRWVTVEVRAKAGCSGTAKWTLTVYGNQS